jgi:hypothetical protein
VRSLPNPIKCDIHILATKFGGTDIDRGTDTLYFPWKPVRGRFSLSHR